MAKVQINRAPVLTLWAVVVAERLGYDHDAALTLGKAVAGLNAQAKGQRLGLYHEAQGQEVEREREPRARREGEEFMVNVLGRAVPAVDTEQGLRATAKGQPINPESVSRYLQGKFGDDLADVQAVMEALAESYGPDALAARAYELYEQFRPAIPEGKKGWGAVGDLDLDQIRALAGRAK